MNFCKGFLCRFLAVCLVFILASAEHPEHSEDDIMEARRYCHNITATEEEETSDAIKIDDPAEVKREIKCYWQCYMKEVDWMDANGKINEKPNISPEPCWVKYSSACLDSTGADDCDKAFNFMQCFAKNTEKEQATDESCH